MLIFDGELSKDVVHGFNSSCFILHQIVVGNQGQSLEEELASAWKREVEELDDS